jgi:hypothetical protein
MNVQNYILNLTMKKVWIMIYLIKVFLNYNKHQFENFGKNNLKYITFNRCTICYWRFITSKPYFYEINRYILKSMCYFKILRKI